MFETLNVTHCCELLQREPTHMAKIDEMLSQIAKGRARKLTALRGCFVSIKSNGKVVEGDVAAPDKHQVEQITKKRAEPICHPRRQACKTAERACRQAVKDMISEGLHET